MSILSLPDQIKDQAIQSSYRIKCEVLEKKVAELEARLSQLELALELYRKDMKRES